MLVATPTVASAAVIPVAITAVAITGSGADDVPERTVIVREVGGIQHLQARIVLAIEWRLRRRATRALCRLERIKPQSEVVHLNRIEGRIQGGTRNYAVVENGRRRRGPLRERKRLDTEAAHELGMAAPAPVSRDVT